MFSFYLLTVIAAASAAVPAQTAEIRSDCTINNFDQVSSVTRECTDIVVSGLSVPAGKTLDLQLKTGTTLTFQGETVFEVANWIGPLLLISGDKITVKGAVGHVLDGQGAQYWDGLGELGVLKPKFVRIEATGGSVFSDLYVLNCPRHCVSINRSENVTLDRWNVDVSAGDENQLGHNTDGFDIASSTNVYIANSVVKNQDDCVAVNKAQHVTISNLQCSGGHGLSLSVGMSKTSFEDNTLTDVHFKDCTVSNSANGIHVKTHSDGGPGMIDNVSYRNIRLSGITGYGVNIEQDYEQGKPTGKPNNNIPITGLSITGVTGSMAEIESSEALYILCASGSCSGWTWDVSITGAGKPNSCTDQPSNVEC